MKIYLLEQNLNNGYDTYDSADVIAEKIIRDASELIIKQKKIYISF